MRRRPGKAKRIRKAEKKVIGVARVRFEIYAEERKRESKKRGRGWKDGKGRSGKSTEEAGEDGRAK